MAINPTAFEQYLLELINWARANPTAQASQLGIDLNASLAPGTISTTAKQPLVFNEFLIASSRAHSQWMIDADIFSHTGLNGSDPTTRMTSAGYVFAAPAGSAENISFVGSSGALDLTASVLSSHNNLFESSGHRVNLMNGAYKEVGVGAPTGEFLQDGTNFNAMLVTENFAFSGTQSYLTGVVIDDLDNNDFYGIGEGRGGVAITAVGGAGTFTTTTWDAGGYRLALPAGTYAVTFSYNGTQYSANATVGAANVKVDAEIGAFATAPTVPITGTPNDDPLNGGASNDTFIASGGNDTLDGCGGLDIVTYTGARSTFQADLQGSTILITKPGAAADSLTSIERVNFDDGHLIFDLASASAPAAYRLYGGAFDRTPDEGGLRFWTNDWLGAGRNLHDAAVGFIQSQEFTTLYGSNLSDADFIDQLYLNVLDRPGETAGIDFWNSFLAQDTGDRADVLVNFTQLPEYVGNSAADISDGYWVV